MNRLFSQSVQADILGFNNLLRIKLPYHNIIPGHVLKIDHIFWNADCKEIVMSACMHNSLKIYPRDDLFLDKYKPLDKQFKMIPLTPDTSAKALTLTCPAPCLLS